MPQFPQVNINGTSKDALLKQSMKAYHAVTAAVEALCEGAPHGRDYQTLPAGSYEQARAEHYLRLSKLESVKAELEAFAIHLQD